MKMKSALLMFIISVFFAFHSCLDYSLPDQIELGIEGTIDLPLKISTGNWGSLLIDPLENAFSGGFPDGIGVKIYSVDYGQDVQAFCVNIPIEISTSLSPDDYMKDIDNLINTDTAWKIEESFEVPSLGFTIDCPVSFTLPSITPNGTSIVSYPEGISFSISKVLNLGSESSVNPYFLHALIEEGVFNIKLELSEGDVTLAEGYTKTYNIEIKQDTDDTSSPGSPYAGLAYSNSSQVLKPLDTQNINKNDVKVSGKVILKSENENFSVTKKPGGNNELKGKLIITMDIKKFAVLDIDWSKTSIFNKPITPDPVSLADIAEYLNWIEFDKCDDTNQEPKKGIGINMSFTEIIGGLEMNIKCPELSINATKPLKLKGEGNNVFGNGEALTGAKRLQLDKPKTVTDLHFNITLRPAGNNTVLHIPNLDLTKLDNGKKKINGEAKLFYNWEKAQVKITEVLQGSNNGVSGGAFTGTFPDIEQDEEPINLALLDGFIDGLNIMESDIKASAYLSGPNQTINNNDVLQQFNPKVLITAEYSGAHSPVTIINKDPITLMDKQIDIANDDYYINTHVDKNGNKIKTYKRNELPPGGNDFKKEFVNIINDRPSDLVFHYEVKLPETIDVTREMFFNNKEESVPHNILVNIILLMHMRLTAGADGGRIMYPGTFDEDHDLFGRESADEDSIFTSLNVDYINLSVDLPGSFFTGGYLFIEKSDAEHTPKLFPQGISLSGRKISRQITQVDFDTIRRNYPIVPDFWLKFAPGEAITIPKNIGITSVKIEAKGKTLIKLDF